MIQKLLNAAKFSISGLKHALQHERAFRQELLITCLLTPLALSLGQTPLTRLLLILSLLQVLVVELLNTGLEKALDRLSKEHHPLTKVAKDVASAAVLLTILMALITWSVILYSGL